jgi:hypothetical protein
MEHLTILEHEEQAALSMLREATARRLQAVKEQQEQRTLHERQLHEEFLAAQAALRPVTVFSVTYESLYKNRKKSALRFIKVHNDVLSLLHAAIPSANDEQFSELCSDLVQRLAGNGKVREYLDTVRVKTEYARYFDDEALTAQVVILAEGRISSTKCEVLAEWLTAYSLKWGEATQFEGSE